MKKILALTLAVGTLAVSGIAIARYTDKNDLGSMTPTNKETTAPNPQSGEHITCLLYTSDAADDVIDV